MNRLLTLDPVISRFIILILLAIKKTKHYSIGFPYFELRIEWEVLQQINKVKFIVFIQMFRSHMIFFCHLHEFVIHEHQILNNVFYQSWVHAPHSIQAVYINVNLIFIFFGKEILLLQL